jgi:hypothetical protein
MHKSEKRMAEAMARYKREVGQYEKEFGDTSEVRMQREMQCLDALLMHWEELGAPPLPGARADAKHQNHLFSFVYSLFAQNLMQLGFDLTTLQSGIRVKAFTDNALAALQDATNANATRPNQTAAVRKPRNRVNPS